MLDSLEAVGKVGIVTGGGRILVVDDDALLRSSVAAILADEGYEVDLAGDGVDALERIHENPPDVILLDVLMPRMNGKALLETLHARQHGTTSSISVLVMTALHGFESRRTIALGATDLVEKPFDIDDLLNKIALAVYRARQGREASEQGAPAAEPHTRGVVLVVGEAQRGVERVDRTVAGLGYTPVSLMHVTDELPRLVRLLEPRAIVLAHSSQSAGGPAARRLLQADPTLGDIPIVEVGADGDDASELARLLA